MRSGASAPTISAPIVEPKPDALPVPPDAPSPPSAPTARAAATAVGVSPEAAAVWSKVVQTCVQQHPLLRALVTNSMLVSLNGDTALLSCAERFAAGAPRLRDKLSEVFTRERGTPTTVEFEQPGQAAAPTAPNGASAEQNTAASDAAEGETASAPAVITRPVMPGPGALEHPLVKQAIDLFGARVVDVQPRRSS